MSQDRTDRAADQGVQGPRRGRPRRHRPRRRLHRRRLLRPHARRVRPARAGRPDRPDRAATPTSTPTTPSRTPRSCSARRCARRSATRPASAASATPPCRSTRRWCRPSSTCPAAPTACTPASPRARQYVADRRHDATSGSLTRHVFETLAFHAQLALHVRVLSGRDPHHIVEAQFKAFARAFRDAVALDPRETGVPVHQGHALRPMHADVVVLDYGSGNLRSAVRAVERAGADGHADRRLRRRAGRRRAASCPASARSPRAWPACARSRATRSSAAGWPAAGRCSASASGMQVLFERGVEHGVETEGCDEWPGDGRAAAGAGRAAHGLEHRRRRPTAPRCSPASRTSGSTSCTPTASATGTLVTNGRTRAPAGDLGRARRRPVRRRRRERPAHARPSSTPRSPATPGAALLRNWVESCEPR